MSTKGRSEPLREDDGPTRTCVGCGRKAPKEELLRFVDHDGVLALGETDPGRGAYTCRRLACFERARSKNAFNRTLRRSVRVDRDLFRLFREPLHTGSTLTSDHG